MCTLCKFSCRQKTKGRTNNSWFRAVRVAVWSKGGAQCMCAQCVQRHCRRHMRSYAPDKKEKATCAIFQYTKSLSSFPSSSDSVITNGRGGDTVAKAAVWQFPFLHGLNLRHRSIQGTSRALLVAWYS